MDNQRFLPIMSEEDHYYLGNGDLFFPLCNYFPDRTATKRISLFCRRRRGQFKGGLSPVKWRAGWQLRSRELSIGKISAWAKRGAQCDAPNPGGPLTTRQPSKTLVNVG